jgi:radical SAM-linked protein
MNESEKAQRLRVRFARGLEAGEIGHLDLARCWERAFCAAGLRVSQSQGNRKQARITIAAGLPVGVTSEGELLDVVLAQRTEAAGVAERVQPHLPPGLTVLDVREVGLGLPSLPSAVRWADYEVDVRDDGGPRAKGQGPGRTPDYLAAAIETFLARESLPWTDTRGEKTRHYDLRALVQDVRVESRGEGARLTMRLRCDAGGAGRPDQVVKALGLPEASRIHRTRLVVADASPAREAWRRRGRYLG